MSIADSVETMWDALAAQNPAAAEAGYSAWHFCDNKVDANELAELVLAGTKRATAGLVWAYEAEDEPLPQVGDYSVVTDWDGNARCIIRSTSVEIVPFDAVSAQFAATEGEGDGSLDYWRRVHEVAFTRELSESGEAFHPEILVVCETFELAYRE
jgi:uncharacterized protein YhfF